MLASIRVIASKSAVGRSVVCAAGQQQRMFSDTWKDKENAIENAYFNKSDEEALRKLLKKMKSQADKADTKGKHHHEQKDKQGLDKILSGAKLSKEQIEALMKWKHDQH